MRNKPFLLLLTILGLALIAFAPGAPSTTTTLAALRMAPTAAPTPPAAQHTGETLTIHVPDYTVTEVPLLRSVEFQVLPTSDITSTAGISATLTSTGEMTATGNITAQGAITNTMQTLHSSSPVTGTNVITVSWNPGATGIPWNIKTSSPDPVEIQLHFTGPFSAYDFQIKRVAPLPATAGFNDGAPSISAAHVQQNVSAAVQVAPTASNQSPPPVQPPAEPVPPAGPNTNLYLLLIVVISAVAIAAALRLRRHARG